MSNNLFDLRGAEIYSNKSGKLVATLDEYGEYHLRQGMYSYEPALREFLGYKTEPPAAPAVPEIEEKPEFADLGTAEKISVPLPPPDEEIDEYHFGSGSIGTIPAPHPEKKPVIDSDDKQLVYDIPEHVLPVMDPALGRDTPAVRSFAEKYNLTENQISLLVVRIEKRR